MKIDKILILLFIFCLPYNNFPYGVGGSLTPLSLIPLTFFILFRIIKFFVKLSIKINKFVFFISLIFFTFLLYTILNDFYFWDYFSQKKVTSPFFRTFQFFIYSFISIGSFYIGYVSIKQYKDIDKLLKIIFFAYLPSLFFGFLEIIFNNSHVLNIIRSFFASTKFPDGYYRIYLLTTEPSWAAFDLATFIIPLAIYFYFRSKKILNIILVLLSISLLIFTKSLLGFITFSLSIFIFILIYHRLFLRNTKYVLIFMFTLVFFIISISLFKDIYIERFNRFIMGSDTSAITRTVGYQVAWEIFKEHPLFGVGFRNSGYFYRDIVYSIHPELISINLISDWADFYSKRFPDIKSTILEIISSVGLFGLLILFLFFYKLYKHISIIQDTNIKLLFSYILLSSIFGSFSIILIGYPVFWFFIGLLLSIKSKITK